MLKAAADRKANRNYKTVTNASELDDVFKDL